MSVAHAHLLLNHIPILGTLFGLLLLYLLGVSLWLAYGVRIDAVEVIGANIVAGALVFTALFMKLRSKK